MSSAVPPKSRRSRGCQLQRRATILLADDHAMVVDGLRLLLEPEFHVVGAVGDGNALVSAAATLRPDVIVADISMPVLSGIEAVRRIRQSDRGVTIVFLTMHSDQEYASEAIRVGASAYLLKSCSGAEIMTSIREALRAGRSETAGLGLPPAVPPPVGSTMQAAPRLPPRQLQVLQLTAEGRTTKEMAEILQISPRTVEFHRYPAMGALGVHTIAGLVRYAIAHRLVSSSIRSGT